MDTRADPLGVCIHRSSFIDARIRVNLSLPSTSQKSNAVDSSEQDTDFGQKISCSTGNVQGKVLHIAGSITGGSTSTIWPNADSSSTALVPPEVFTLPKRSRSCNDLTETSATVTKVYSQKSGAPRTRGANMPWTNNLRETDVDGHSSDAKSHKPPDLPHHGPNDSKLIKEEDYNPSQEIREVKTLMVRDQSTQTELIKAHLGVSPRTESIDQRCVSTSSSRPFIEAMGIQKEDEEFFWAPRLKRRKQGTEGVKPVIDTRDVVDDAGDLSHRAPFSFNALKWLSVLNSIANLQYDPPSNYTGVDAWTSKDRIDGQFNLRPELTRSSVSSPNSLGRSEDLSQLPTSANTIESALDKFNGMIPNCDAKKRFEEDPTRCLGNSKKDGSRCGRAIKSDNDREITQSLRKLEAMNIKINEPKCVIDELGKLIELAICYNQCGDLRKKVNLLVLPYPPKDSTRPSASPIQGQETQAVDDPFVISAGKITSWCRELPKGASVYLPDYRPFQSASSYKSNVEDWIMKQAATPLTVSELTAGHLYVYWNQASFGVSKIGYTSNDVGERLRAWESQCKHIAEEQYRSPCEVRNVKRLERLVHAELKAYRVKEHGCPGCSEGHVVVGHEEWFNGVGLDIILESIAFWTEWIMEGQYEEIESEWRLKEGARKGLQLVCKLCTRMSVANAKESKEKSIMKSPLRHSPRPRLAKGSPSHGSRGR